MDRARSIVAPVDFTPCSLAAVRQAVRIAKWNQARLDVLHVVAEDVVTELEGVLSPHQQDIRSGLVEDARREWQRLTASDDALRGLPLSVEVGHPVGSVLQRLNDSGADLLVMGVHGASHPGGGAGTVATACVRKAHGMVLLVREEQAAPFKSIVACIDFSPTSLRALNQAVRIALQDGAALHVLHVFEGPWHRTHYRAPTPLATPDQQKQYIDGLRGRLESFCKPLATEMGYLNPQFHVLDHRGYGDGITEFVRHYNVELAVLGTKGKTNLRYMLWGRTAERVVRNSPCSILVVRPEDTPAPQETAAARPMKPAV
ncbi:MAG: universal stress protein [Planctomycetia bacterium]|nr:MAG: universal stress protein [Planctomycetia bacterium]